MFRSLFQDHLQVLSLALSAYHASAARFVICLYWYVDVCSLYLYPLYLPECCLVVNDKTALSQVQGIQIQTEGIRPHTNTDI
jgi:hypothetical protein